MSIKTCILRTAHLPQAIWDTEDAVGFTLVASDPLSSAAPADTTGYELVDPSTVTFSLRTPSGATETHVLGTSEDLVRESQGRYRVNLPVDESGVFAYRWAVAGDYQGVGESRLIVRRSPFTTPAVTVDPVISGSPVVGQILSCTTGTWSRNPTEFSYRWLRDGVAIGGATGSTYLLVIADFGHDISCEVTATNNSGDSSAVSNELSIDVPLPVNTVLPSITGIPGGAVATAHPGTWDTSSTPTFTYQWIRCDAAGANGVDIAGETNSSYTLVGGDANKTLRVRVTCSDIYGDTSATSAASAQIAGPINTGLPSVTTINMVPGATISAASPGTWSSSSTPSFTYQWVRCDLSGANGVDILGATGTTYALTEGDIDTTLRVRVTATDAFGSTSAASVQTAAVHFPSQSIFISPLIGSTANTNWSTITLLTDAFGASLVTSTGAQNASISMAFYAEEGTYTLDLLHRVSTNIGIYTITIDGVALGTAIDGYSTVGGGARGTITNVVIPTTGTHSITLTMAAKNTAASSYIGSISSVTFTRTT